MKNHIATGITIALMAAAVCGASERRLVPVDAPWDFGRIGKGTVEEQTFTVHNNGNETVEIRKVHACCGYGLKDISSWTIEPGDTAAVTITCDATRKATGKDRKYITIIHKGRGDANLKIPVEAFIVEGEPQKLASKIKGGLRSLKDRIVSYPSMSVIKLHEIIEAAPESVFLLDVREEFEFKEKHLENAYNVPRSSLDISERSFAEILREHGESDMIAVYCGGGVRSSYVARKLQEMGHNAFNVTGGITAWEKKGYPLVTGPKTPPSELPLILNLEEAYQHYYVLFNDKVVWIDVRDPAAYRKGHIKGARNIPLTTIRTSTGDVPRDKELVLYCDNTACGLSKSAGMILIKKGFKQPKVKVLTEGFEAWEKAGLPIERET